MIEILQVIEEQDLGEVRRLFLEYASSLGISLDFQDFDREMEGLPGDYVPPDGGLFMALCLGEVAGCGALRRLSGPVCEMKRLFIRPEFRGLGIGRAICEALITKARAAGYRLMRLDTLPTMSAAMGLYRTLGFREIPPYRFNPVEGSAFLELDLD